MPLSSFVRRAFYVAFATLFISGGVWLLTDEPDSQASAWLNELPATLLKVHGGAAMLCLLLLGAFAVQHIPASWRGRNNRLTGTVMIAINGVLIVTAYGLYYSGSDLVRGWVSNVHIAAGLAVPVVIAHHIWSGRRRQQPARRRDQRTGAGAFRTHAQHPAVERAQPAVRTLSGSQPELKRSNQSP